MKEKRKALRSEFAWPVSIWLGNYSRFYNGRMVNISRLGAMFTLPLETPISAGEALEINFPRTATLAKRKGQAGRIKVATVKRVQRDDWLTVAVEFTDPNPEMNPAPEKRESHMCTCVDCVEEREQQTAAEAAKRNKK